MNILVTGGSGFIGSNWIRKRLKEYPDDIICNIDKLTYAANVDTDFGGRRDLFDKEYFTWKEDYHPHRYHHWKCDICDEVHTYEEMLNNHILDCAAKNYGEIIN